MTTPTVTIKKSTHLSGTVTVPGDKSISHRAVIFGAIAEGITKVTGFLPGEDNFSTIKAFMAMGVDIKEDSPTELTIQGKGLRGLTEPANIIDAGNSGTTTRLLIGLLAAQPFTSTITGDVSLRERPMMRVVEPLRKMGAVIDGRDEGRLLPLTIKGGELKAIDHKSPVASAQLKSCLLIAGLYAEGTTTVTEPMKSRDHTERMLWAFGVGVDVDGNSVSIGKERRLKGTTINVPGDISSAAFFIVGAIITKGSKLRINNVGLNPTRIGIIDILKKMGASIEVVNQKNAKEPAGDLIVRSCDLKGIDIDGAELLPAIDEFPIICVAAAFAKGTTRITGAGELRVKESDRIFAMARALEALDVEVEEEDNGIIIVGSADSEGLIRGGSVGSSGDHRIAMAMAIAGLASREGVEIRGPECVDVSYPGFFKDLKRMSRRRRPVIAIDGPSGVGKSTVSRAVAERFNYEYVDTGAMYRAVAIAAADKGLDLGSDKELAEFCENIEIHFEDNGTRIFLNKIDLSGRIRSAEAGEQASRSSALPSVRRFLVGLQREMGSGGEGASHVSPGVVMEGRDIGTNVFKDADIKIYLDADEKVRAARRHGDYKSEKENKPSAADVKEELAERDRRDKERKLAPLAMDGDAVLIDTTELGIDEVVGRIAALMKERGIAG